MNWFKHKTNAHKSPYCQELFHAFGKSQGYGLFCLFTSFMADKWDGKSEPFFRIRFKELQNFLELSPQKLQKFIKIPTNAEALTIKKDGSFLEINFPKLQEIKDEYSKKSRQKPDVTRDKLPVHKEKEEDIRIRTEEEEEKLTPPSKDDRNSSIKLLQSVETWNPAFEKLIHLELGKLEMQNPNPDLISEAFCDGTMAFLATYAAEAPLPRKFVNSLRSHVIVALGNVLEKSYDKKETELFNPDTELQQ